MRILISEGQLEYIKEVSVQNKMALGRGAMHKVYPSEINPGIVYKIGEIEDIDKWYDIFKKNPEVFPRVYRRGVTRIERRGKEYVVGYVILERLDTDSFEKFWGVIEEYFDYDFVSLLELNKMNDLYEMGEVIEVNEGEGFYKKYMELLKLIDKIRKLVKSPDLHGFNFGFDNKGRIKCLDI